MHNELELFHPLGIFLDPVFTHIICTSALSRDTQPKSSTTTHRHWIRRCCSAPCWNKRTPQSKASYSVGDYRLGTLGQYGKTWMYICIVNGCMSQKKKRFTATEVSSGNRRQHFTLCIIESVVTHQRPRLDFIFEANERFHNQTVLLDGAFEEGEPLYTTKAACN